MTRAVANAQQWMVPVETINNFKRNEVRIALVNGKSMEEIFSEPLQVIEIVSSPNVEAIWKGKLVGEFIQDLKEN